MHFFIYLEIEQDGSCPLCNDGILNTISIQEDLGKELKINYSIDNNLLTTNSFLSLNIVDVQLCIIQLIIMIHIPCKPDYYNLYPNNIQYCKSCDPDETYLLSKR